MMSFYYHGFNTEFVIPKISAEHLLKIISTAFYSTLCIVDKTDPFEDYFRIQLKELFGFFDYSIFIAVFGTISNILSTFLWTYMDVFIMVTSVGLSTQFRKINQNLKKYKGQVSGMPFKG